MRKSALILLMAAGLLATRAAAADRIVTIVTRDAVTQGFLLMEPDVAPVGTVLMFPPHEGRVSFKPLSDGRFKVKRGGWLGQTVERYLASGFAVAVIEPPSDRPQGIEEDFRQSPEHAADVRRVVAYLTDRIGHKPFLAGTCRSTYSVASVAGRLDDRSIAGVILASSRTKGRKAYGPITEGVGRGTITAPMLFVHHTDDDCEGSPYGLVGDVLDFFRGGAKKVELVTVTGGYRTAARKQRRGCGENGSHKFYGAQAPTVTAIIDWMRGRTPPPVIDAGS